MAVLLPRPVALRAWRVRTKSFETKENRHEYRIDDCGRLGRGGFEELPERVREALGELAGAAKEGLLALAVRA